MSDSTYTKESHKMKLTVNSIHYTRLLVLAVAVLATILAVTCRPAQAQPVGIAYNVENIRDLYEVLLRHQQEAAAAAAAAAAADAAAAVAEPGSGSSHSPSMFVHQMERKGGRSPTLRLRFGRRADPLWGRNGPLSREPAATLAVEEQ